MDEMYKEFLNIATNLNNKFEIVPLLYGSLGLSKITGMDLSPDDIDILIPEIYLVEKWNILKRTIEELGYKIIDLHEHTFIRGKFKIAFANIEGLIPFAGIDIEQIESKDEKGIKYMVLNLEEFLKVYLQSSKDGYRKSKNNNKDFSKIAIIKQLLVK